MVTYSTTSRNLINPRNIEKIKENRECLHLIYLSIQRIYLVQFTFFYIKMRLLVCVQAKVSGYEFS